MALPDFRYSFEPRSLDPSAVLGLRDIVPTGVLTNVRLNGLGMSVNSSCCFVAEFSCRHLDRLPG